MKCQKCFGDFDEREIQLSHDVPKYVGGTDSDGRHNLCKKCHDIYERMVFSQMVGLVPPKWKKLMIIRAKIFANSYFKIEEEEQSR